MAIAEKAFFKDITVAGNPITPMTGLTVYIYNPDLNSGIDMQLTEVGFTGRYVNNSVDAGSYEIWLDGTHLTGTRHKRFEPFSAEEISTAGLKDEAITPEKMIENAVGNRELGGNAVREENIKSYEVSPSKMSTQLVILPGDPLTITVPGNFIGQLGSYDNKYYVCISKTVIPLWEEIVPDDSIVPKKMGEQTEIISNVNLINSNNYIGQPGRSATGYDYICISLTSAPYWEIVAKKSIDFFTDLILWSEVAGLLFPKTTPSVGVSFGCQILNLPDPTNASDGANKGYVDNLVSTGSYFTKMVNKLGITPSIANVFNTIAPTNFTEIDAKNFSVSGNNFKYTGTETTNFEVEWDSNIETDAAATAYLVVTRFTDGVTVSSVQVSSIPLEAANIEKHITGSMIYNLKQDEYITARVAVNLAGTQVTVNKMRIRVKKWHN